MTETSPEEALRAVLDRRIDIPALGALVHALRPHTSDVSLTEVAIGFDANVFLRLAAHGKSDDIIDYFASDRAGPLILPGQAIQEFWNNQFSAVDSAAAPIKRKYAELQKLVEEMDPEAVDLTDGFKDLLQKFDTEYGFVYSEQTARKTYTLLDILN